MHTIDPESGGLTAARRAAETKSSSSGNIGGKRAVPSFKVYRQFTFYIILPIWRAICSIGRFIKTQAKNIVHGKRPYHIEIHFIVCQIYSISLQLEWQEASATFFKD